MESCKSETAAKGGWTQQEDRLLLSAAQSARQDGRALRSVCEDVAAQTGRKPNSIRNYYYERIKQGDVEGELCRGAAFVPFERDEVRAMLRTILAQRAKGVSVRSCTLAMGNGDTRSMLRYQNKYRAVLKTRPEYVKKLVERLRAEGVDCSAPEVNRRVRQSAEAATAEGVQLRVDAAVDVALALPEVRQITVLAPVRPTRAPQDASTGTPDAYWDLELPLLREDGSLPWQKLRNMERRALRDVEVVREAWQPDHAALVQDFLRRKPFEPGTVHIFSQLESYVGSHPDVQLWAARHREDNSLQAFAVGDYASLTTAFYMFAFRRQDAVPGCADALLAGLVSEAEARGHMRFCLGLGIDPGIRFFKRKWHARPALPCLETGWSTRATTSGGGWFSRLRRLLGGEEAA